MKTIAAVIAIVAAVMYAVALILTIRYCTAGFYGYPDIWSNRTAKKIYFILAPASTVLMILSAVIFVALCSL